MTDHSKDKSHDSKGRDKESKDKEKESIVKPKIQFKKNPNIKKTGKVDP